MKSLILSLFLLTAFTLESISQIEIQKFSDSIQNNKYVNKLTEAKEMVYQYKLDHAIALYEEIYKTDTINISIIQELEALYTKTSAYNSALIFVNKILRIDTSNCHYLIKKGIILEKMKEYDKAISIFKTALQNDASNHYLITQIADAYRNINNVDSAYYYYSIACNIKPNNSILIKASDILLKNKKNQEVILLFEKYNYPEKKYSKVLHRLYGKALYLCDSIYDAYEVFNDLHKKGDSSQVTNKFLGLSSWKIKHYTKGEEMLAFYTKKDSTDYLAYYVLGRCCLHNNKPQESIKYITKSYNLYQNNPQTLTMIYKALAESYEWIQNYDKAIEYYALIEKSDSKNIYGRYKIAMIYDYDLKNKQKALKQYNDLLQKFNNTPTSESIIEAYCKRRKNELEESEFWKGQ